MQIKDWWRHLLNPILCQVQKLSYLCHFYAETNETWKTHSSAGDTRAVIIKLCYHGNLLFSSPHQFILNI